jgi:hypothetical protein
MCWRICDGATDHPKFDHSLTFASEKDGSALTKRVLGILLEVTRAETAYLAMQNSLQEPLKLRGAGRHENMALLDVPIDQAAGHCPVEVMQYVAHTQKVGLMSERSRRFSLTSGIISPTGGGLDGICTRS